MMKTSCLTILLLVACGESHVQSSPPETDAATIDLAPLEGGASPPDALPDLETSPVDGALPPAGGTLPPAGGALPPAGGTLITRLGSPPYELELREAPLSVRLLRDGQILAHLRAITAAFARTPEHANDRARFFDPAHDGSYPLEWRTFEFTDDRSADGLPTRVVAGDLSAAFHASVDAEGRFGLSVLPEDSGALVQLRLVFDAPEGEQYYGLGELFDQPFHRGKRRPMHIGVDINSEGLYAEYHVAVPLLIGTSGWGLLVHDHHAGDFDVAARDAALVQVTYEAKSLAFTLIGATRPMDVLPHYVDMTGQPAIPAEWAFGGWIWRNENRDQAEVLEDVRAIRDHDLPMSGLWIDRPWSTALNTYVPDPVKFPDPPAMVAALHAAGLRLAFWAAPYIHPDATDDFAFATENDYFADIPAGWFRPFDAFILDLTRSEVRDWYQTVIGRSITLGAQGFKLDYGEDVQIGIGMAALPWNFYNGETERTMHHRYALYYHQTFAELVGAQEGQGFILSRAGTTGDQVYTTTIWPGDLCNGFEEHLENRHVGGLPAAISGGLSVGTVGYPWFASDTGGYRHGRASKAVFLRWTAYSALGSLLQTGGSKHHNPWDFAEYETGRDEEPVSRFDEEVLEVYRQFARLYIRLHAYRDPFNQDAHQTGRPVTRPIGFVYPELGVHSKTEFLLGDSLFVAPVFDETGMVTVHLPPGEWYDWFTGEGVAGGAAFERQVPYDRIALYVRAGAIVPLLRDTVDTLSPATDADVDSYADDPGILTLRIYPGDGPSTFTTLGGTTITVSDREVTLSGDHFSGYIVEAHGDGPVRRVERGPGPQIFERP